MERKREAPIPSNDAGTLNEVAKQYGASYCFRLHNDGQLVIVHGEPGALRALVRVIMNTYSLFAEVLNDRQLP